MCGRFALSSAPPPLVDLLNLDGLPTWEARYNIAPTQNVLCVREMEDSPREGTLLQWGLIPRWASEPKMGTGVINARCESLSEKPWFRDAYKKRRCLILADAFYEWQREGKKHRQPYAIRMEDDAPFAFAGLWETWVDPEGKEIEATAIVTTNANEILKPFHERMPVIVRAEDYEEWLDPTIHVLRNPDAIFESFPASKMKVYPVSKLVSNVKNDVPECLAREATLF